MLHGIDYYGSNTIVIAFYEVQAFLRTFWKKDVTIAIKEVDARGVPMIGTLKANDEWLLIARSLDVF
jgi:hypothetical protein